MSEGRDRTHDDDDDDPLTAEEMRARLRRVLMLPRPPRDVDKMRITSLADSVYAEIEASRRAVSDGFSPEAREELDALRELLVEAGLERRVANQAVDRLIETRRPIFECIAAAAAHVPTGG
jgi:hypothetical protein